ncbi:hypothetical protein QJQ45_004952 [Haematococcus lacustris]|nr:hypothetical protein QJQ45_004952 [Haematococcus lacustris]
MAPARSRKLCIADDDSSSSSEEEVDDDIQQAGSKKRRKATLAVTVDPEVTEAVVNKVGDGLRDKSKKCYASQMKHFGKAYQKALLPQDVDLLQVAVYKKTYQDLVRRVMGGDKICDPSLLDTCGAGTLLSREDMNDMMSNTLAVKTEKSGQKSGQKSLQSMQYDGMRDMMKQLFVEHGLEPAAITHAFRKGGAMDLALSGWV